jgi:antitoxin MazE
MNAKVQKWGNSLAVRIPQPFAREIGLSANSDVELSIADGKLVVAPERRRRYKLSTLLAKVKKANLQKEVEFGRPVGREEL